MQCNAQVWWVQPAPMATVKPNLTVTVYNSQLRESAQRVCLAVNNAMYAACVRNRSQSRLLHSIVPKAHCGALCVVHRPLYPVTFDETNFAFVRLNKVALGKATLELVFCDQSLNRLPGELVSVFLIMSQSGRALSPSRFLQNSKPVDIQVQQENEAEFLLQ